MLVGLLPGWSSRAASSFSCGVDAYGDGHFTQEYKVALRAVCLSSDDRLLRMNFSQAVGLFPDASFDFIYVDEFAHTGLEGGRPLAEWFPWLKPGGIMAGYDYDLETWPLVVWAVHEVASQLNVALRLTDIFQDKPKTAFLLGSLPVPTRARTV